MLKHAIPTEMAVVEVVYTPLSQNTICRTVPFVPGLTVEMALEQSGLNQTYPEVMQLPIGIFSKIISKETRLKPGDRIEIYRPLRCDPKEKRRQRAK